MELIWVDAVALALGKHGGTAHLNRLYDDAPRIYGRRPATFDSLVRQTLESHSSLLDNFERGFDLFDMPQGKGAGIYALRNSRWTVGDVISAGGQLFLLEEAIDAYPSIMGGDRKPREKLRHANLIEFAQQILPGLSFWKQAH